MDKVNEVVSRYLQGKVEVSFMDGDTATIRVTRDRLVGTYGSCGVGGSVVESTDVFRFSRGALFPKEVSGRMSMPTGSLLEVHIALGFMTPGFEWISPA